MTSRGKGGPMWVGRRGGGWHLVGSTHFEILHYLYNKIGQHIYVPTGRPNG